MAKNKSNAGQAVKHQERLIQCGYHLGSAEICRLVQLTHDRKEWQEPKWICAPCREYLTGRWRYYHGELRQRRATEKAKQEAGNK